MSEAVEIVSKLLACYPNGGQGAGRGYIGALGAVLVTYPAVIARKSNDPIVGVPRECKFLPTPADVIAWCERETAALRKPVDHADYHGELSAKIKELRAEGEYWDKARLQRPSVAEMKAQYGSDWGLRDPLRRTRPPLKPYVPLTDADLRRIYGKRHDEPEGIEF